jgi:hypothetical protein
MSDLDIFEVGQPQEGKFFYFKQVGDAVQGTYVDVREGRDTFGNDQYIYALKKDGEIWNVGVRKTNTFLNEKMRNIKLGQIVGFKYLSDRESKKSPTGTAKNIVIFASPDAVDHEWLEQRARLSHLYTATPSPAPAPQSVTPVSAPIPTDTAAAAPRVSDSHQAVRNLAVTKGLVEETMAPEVQDAVIAATVGLQLTEANMPAIIIKLAEYKK